jgi:hypothetical protein
VCAYDPSGVAFTLDRGINLSPPSPTWRHLDHERLERGDECEHGLTARLDFVLAGVAFGAALSFLSGGQASFVRNSLARQKPASAAGHRARAPHDVVG